MTIDEEFLMLDKHLKLSGCDKKQVVAGTWVRPKSFPGDWSQQFFLQAANSCCHGGDKCPRLELPSGEGYELCQATHAEAALADLLIIEQLQSLGTVWLLGHYYACEPCAAALKSIGVKEIRIRETI